MATYFISDLHLEPARPDITSLFCDFIQNLHGKADALYILGDLFEYWIGDDHQHTLSNTVSDALKSLVDSGVKVYFIHGNRDFLIGDSYAAQAGFTILPDPSLIDLYGKQILIMHGDSLCIEDEKYQAFRAKVRGKTFQTEFLKKPLWFRRLLAYLMRQYSHLQNRKKTATIMDVTQSEVIKIMSAYHVNLLIHGHTHRPAIHQLTLKEQPAERIVLNAWHSQGNVLICTENLAPKLVDFDNINTLDLTH